MNLYCTYMQEPPTEEKLNKLIVQNFSTSLMSNQKWVKLLDTVVRHADALRGCWVKLVWDDVKREFSISRYSQFRFNYWESAVEGMISGGPMGWNAYKELEWIEMELSNVEARISLESDLQKAGSFELKSSNTVIKIYAYR